MAQDLRFLYCVFLGVSQTAESLLSVELFD